MNSPTEPTPSTQDSRRPPQLLAVGLLLLTIAAYIPAFNAGFVWDDDSYVTNNSTLTEPGGLTRIWFDIKSTPQYYPMVFTSFWIETKLWGANNAVAFHTLNILLHAFGTILLWRVLSRLQIPGAWLAGAIFAVHPVNVESVAWITERKNTLSLVFYLSAAIQWLKWNLPDHADTSTTKNYVLAVLFFVAALLSKSVTCSLPAALLLVVWLKNGQINRRDILGASVLFVVGITAACLTVWLESQHVGADKVDWNLTVLDRFMIAGRVIWFYAGKLLWPNPLIFIYPKWNIDAGVWWQWLFPLSAIAVPIVLFAKRTRWGRGPVVASLFFGGTLFPALGFINVYPFRFSYVADHFQYLASLGLIALIAAGISKLLNKYATIQMPKTVCSFFIILMITISFNRCFAYRDIKTLWADTLLQNPNSQLAHTDTAALLMAANRPDLAEPHLRKAIDLDPTFHGAYLRLGIILSDKGAFDEALQHLNKTVEIAPDDYRGFFALGRLHFAQENLEKAEESLEQAHWVDPQALEVIAELAVLSQVQGRFDKALRLFGKALNYAPNDHLLWFNTGVLLGQMERGDEAIKAYQTSISINPNYHNSHFNLGNELAQKGALVQAIEHYRAALSINPRFEPAAHNLNAAQEELGQKQ